ncbi:MAG: AAA family ATPase [Ruminiclostridium sp.]|nr:AAA family ATPase [Ruminiclostridium sp.]
MEQVKEEIIDYIYAMNKLGRVSNEIILFSGPPGTGKTSVARQIAKALGREFYKIPLGGLSDDVFLKGCAKQYSGAKPGTIVDILFKAGHKNILILLDEVDKFGARNGAQDGAAALLDALDHDKAFVDRFIDFPIDLSDIVFVATANNSSSIPSVLYDRMNSIEILPYSNQEKFEI